MDISRRRLREIRVREGVPLANEFAANCVRQGSAFPIVATHAVRISSLWLLLSATLSIVLQQQYWPLVLLLVHIASGSVREAVAQYRRKSASRRWNAETAAVWTGQKFQTCRGERLTVGSVVLILEGQRFPADSALLASSASEGQCYISQYEVLGEVDLALKRAVKETQRILPAQDSPAAFTFARLNVVLKTDPPSLKPFTGKMTVKTLPRAATLDHCHFVPGGSVLLNTRWALALTVYCGMEAQAWLHCTASRPAAEFSPALERWTLLGAVGLLALSATLTLVQFLASREPVTGIDFLLYVLALCSQIPAALFLALDIVSLILQWKVSKKFKGMRFLSGFSEELARVNYVVMDKTGTLTEKEVEVAAVVLGENVYLKSDEKCLSVESTIREFSLRERSELTFTDLEEVMRTGVDRSARRLCESLLLCSDVQPSSNGSFLCLSADEKAVQEFTNAIGCKLRQCDEDHCELELFTTVLRYQVLARRSAQTHMSVLVQREFDTTATLYVKGQYAALKDVMAVSARKELEARLDDMERKGVRGQLMGVRVIDGDLLDEVLGRVHKIKFSQTNEQWKLERLLKELEVDLQLMSVIGLAEIILDETKECVSQLKRSGIVPVIASGDTESCTLACAYALNLVSQDTPIVHIKKMTPANCAEQLLSVARTHVFRKQMLQEDTPRSYFQHAGSYRWSDVALESFDFALSIDSETLSSALHDESSLQLLVCMLCASSFTCFNSLTPDQKREVTRLLQQALRLSPIVLAVGDQGGNAPMLATAHIGVCTHGITNCDISIPHIGVLGRLLLAARNSYQLLSLCVLLFIYSTTTLHVLQLGAMLSANCTSLPVFELEAVLLYCGVCCLLPIIIIGSTKRLAQLNSLPEAYSQKSEYSLTSRRLWRYVKLAIIHAVCILLLVIPAFLVRSATLGSAAELSETLAVALVLTVSQHYCQESAEWPTFLVFPISLGAVFAYYGNKERGLVDQLFATPRLVISGLLAPMSCVVISFFFCNAGNLSKRSKVAPISSQSFVHRLRRESRTLINIYQAPKPEADSATAETADFDLSPVLRFRSRVTEHDYMQHYTLSNLGLFRLALFLTCLQLLGTIGSGKTDAVYHGVACAAAAAVLLCTWFSLPILRLIKCYAALFLIFTFAVDRMVREVYIFVYFSGPVGLLLIMKEQWLSSVAISTGMFVLLVADVAVQCTQSELSWVIGSRAVGTLLVQATVTVLAAVIAHRCNRSSRFQYQLFKETEQRMTQNESVLSVLLPDFVLRQVKDGLRYIAEDSDSVSVLFCELCDFDAICASYSPAGLTALLDDVFQQIDQMCVNLGVAKVETVGKVYMACAGLPDFESEVSSDVHSVPHCQRALELAFAILATFRSYRLQTGALLAFKIGVHTGPVIAGVVGHHKPQFSLVGDTVNTASRMSTTISTPNTIQVSEAAFLALKGAPLHCDFTVRTVFVKGKGEQTAYTVTETSNAFSRMRGRGSTSEDGSPVRVRTRSRNRSSVVASLQESLELQEAVEDGPNELTLKVALFPCLQPKSDSETRFRTDTLRRKLGDMQLGLVVLAGGLLLLGTVKLLQYNFYWEVLHAVASGFFLSAAIAAGVIRVKLQTWVQHRSLLWTIVGLHALAAAGMSIDSSTGVATDLTTLELSLQLVLLFYCSGLFFRHCLLGSALVLCPWAAVTAAGGDWSYVAYLLLFGLQHCVHAYFSERTQRLFFSLNEVASQEIEKTERLLTQMLPVHAYEGLKQEEWVTDRLLKVTLLYADISGFTAWAATKMPQEVVAELSTIYTAFDRICVRLGVYKVHTIGDCYVAMSATNNSDQRDPVEECRRMLSLAKEMRVVLHSRVEQGLDMRIGLHCGDVVGGISGSKVVRYDIYGSDVLIANRMESSGVAGQINVSEDVKSLVESHASDYEFQLHRTITVQEIHRSVRCYFLGTRELYVNGKSAAITTRSFQ